MTSLATAAPVSPANVLDAAASYAAHLANDLAASLQPYIDDHLEFPEIYGPAGHLLSLQEAVRRLADLFEEGEPF